MLMAVCHSAEVGWKQVEDLDRLSDLRAEEGNLLWAEADIGQIEEGDVHVIADEFDLHELAVEDAIHLRQRPKLDVYEGHLFLVFHELQEEDGQLEAFQIACFVGPRYVLTLHEGAGRTLAEAKKRWRKISSGEHDKPAFLVHTLLDVIVDSFEKLADGVEAEVEDLEDILLGAPRAPVQRQLYSVKQRLSRLRRYVLPLQRVLDSLLDPTVEEQISRETHPLLRDVLDHVLRISDQVRNLDELTDAAMDLRRSAEAEVLNDATKRLSGWAAIIAVPTLITGVYGMNVGIWPPVGSRVGFYVILAIMIVLASVMYVYFKRKEWI